MEWSDDQPDIHKLPEKWSDTASLQKNKKTKKQKKHPIAHLPQSESISGRAGQGCAAGLPEA